MQTDQKPCHWCGRTEEAHETDPRPYKALMGFHDYQPTVYEPPIARPDRPAPDGCRCATSEHPGECTCPPANPLMGVHVGSPSGRLPWTDRLPETPAYQTGRVPTDETLRNLAEAARGPTTEEVEENVGRLAEAMRWPLPPAAPNPPDAQDLPAELQSNPAEAFQRDLIRKRPFLGPAIDQVARDLQKQDRPGLLRRIWDAARKDST